MAENNQQLQTAIRAELRDVDTQLTELEKVEAGIAELTGKLKGVVYDVKTAQGMRDAIAGRALARTPRLEVEKIRKAAKAPVLELGRNIDARAKKISEQLEALEDPIDRQIKLEEQRREDEKAAKLEAERRRIAAIQGAIAEMHAYPGQAVGQSPAAIALLLDQAVAQVAPTEAVFGEFTAEAIAAREAALAKLHDLHAAAVKHEDEQEQLRKDREELERLRREDAERRAAQAEADRIEREAAEREAAAARAEADRVAAVEREQLRAAEQERAQARRDEEERQSRERRQQEDEQRRAREEEERIAAEQRGREMAEAARLREAEARKLAEERAEFERRKREQAERELAEQVAKVTLFDAAQDALQLLRQVGQGEHLVSVKLAKILEREAQQAAA